VTRFKPKELSFGFVIILPEYNPNLLNSTFRSIKNRYRENVPITCAVGKQITATELKDIKELCPANRGKDTFTSLINTGINKGHREWNIVVIAGVIIRQKLDQRYGFWIEDEKDVLYPIVVTYNNDMYPIKICNEFYDATLNGLCIHQKTFKEVGDFSSKNPIEIAKKIWALDAAQKGVRFKAILGAKMC
jgi:hypothetical protein